LPNVSVTDTYASLLSTTSRNFATTLPDQVSTSNKLLHWLKNHRSDGYQVTDDIGYQIAIPIIKELPSADSYAGYDEVNVDPFEGITTSFQDWRQASQRVTISGEEEQKNSGENRLINLLQAKLKMAKLGFDDYVGRAILQGNGQAVAAQIRTPKTSTSNGSVFIDPLPKLVDFNPSRSVAVQSINPATAGNEFWRNQLADSGATTFAGFLKVADKLWNDCTKGVGGSPDLLIADQATFELYAAALRVNQRFQGWQKADLPWDALSFHGAALVWDEFVPNAEGDSATQSTSAGTMYMLNTEFIKFKVASGRNFEPTPFVRPENQDARTQLILLMAALCLTSRRKHGVLGSLDTTIAS
jgi:hypothetical protein